MAQSPRRQRSGRPHELSLEPALLLRLPVNFNLHAGDEILSVDLFFHGLALHAPGADALRRTAKFPSNLLGARLTSLHGSCMAYGRVGLSCDRESIDGMSAGYGFGSKAAATNIDIYLLMSISPS
jgi:hypothetical protein